MSWMDSWSRPSKGEAIPPPFYLTHGDAVRYCHTCGRIIGQRRSNNAKAGATVVKYCSDRCKHHKPSTAPGSLDVRIEKVLGALLLGKDLDEPHGAQDAPPKKLVSRAKGKKGDPRLVIQISELETAVFGDRSDPMKVYGRRKNRARRGAPEPEEWQPVDMEDESRDTNNSLTDSDGDNDGVPIDTHEQDMIHLATHARPSQSHSMVNGSVGGEKGWAEITEETSDMLQKRREGQKRAEDLELIKRAARRAVVFGMLVEADNAPTGRKSRVDQEQQTQVRKKCEALMSGKVVEPSFAKGDWSIRWRED